MTGIAPDLLAWWDRHGRKDLPWQRDPTPYRVWVSEVMLQQTQVATVERYYDRFLASFPTAIALADASADAVLHAWSGLGYYSRARNLHRAAQRVRDDHGGAVPTTFEALAELPGIGRSTAGAILALSSGQRFPILDGNVKRVLARVYAIEGSPVDPAVLKRMWALAEENTPADRAAHYTQAVMDLGATLCTRRKPACPRCPLAARCAGLAAGIAERLPSAKPKRARRLRATVVLLVRDGATRVLLEKRPDTGIWGGLWGLPEVAAVHDVAGWCAQSLGVAPARTAAWPVLRHGFTHFDLDMTPVEVTLAGGGFGDAGGASRAGAVSGVAEGERWIWYDVAAPAKVGLAAPVAKLLRGLAEPGLFER